MANVPVNENVLVSVLQTPGVSTSETLHGIATEQEAGASYVPLTGPQEVPEKLAVTVPIEPSEGKLPNEKL